MKNKKSIKEKMIEMWKNLRILLRVSFSIYWFVVGVLCFLVYVNSVASIQGTLYFIGFILSCILTYLILRFGF